MIKEIIKKRKITPDVISEITGILYHTGLLDESVKIAKHHINTARKYLNDIKSSRPVALILELTNILEDSCKSIPGNNLSSIQLH